MDKRTAAIVIVIVVIIGIIVVLSLPGVQSTPYPATDYTASSTSDTSSTDTLYPNSGMQSTTTATSTSNDSTSSTTTTKFTVSLTDAGFVPSPITISKGDSVTFTNESSGQMWVASNPHPTHTDLPGFDEKAAVAPGQSWTYTFKVVGTHGYHNHRNPTIMGVVVVR